MERNATLCLEAGRLNDVLQNSATEKFERQLNLLLLNFDRLDPGRESPDHWTRTALVCDRKERHHRPADAAAELKKNPPPDSSLRNGDIIFQSSSFPEAQLIKKVTNSPLTHCGVLFKEGDDWYVYEAVQPVKKTLLKDFAKNGDDGKYVVRRLKDADTALDQKSLDKMHKFLKDNVGKDYDSKFEWSDDKMYCSELVWKAYKNATGLRVGHTKRMGDWDLTDPDVKKALESRYGKNLPANELTVSPGDIFKSKKLVTVR